MTTFSLDKHLLCRYNKNKLKLKAWISTQFLYLKIARPSQCMNSKRPNHGVE